MVRGLPPALGAVALLAGCGGLPSRGGAARQPPSRIVLQTVVEARSEDVLDTFELVSSAHGELVVRDAAGVRARRRFGFVLSRVSARFAGSPRHVVVSSADDGGRAGAANPRDPFGMWSGVLVRWDVVTDEVTSLAATPEENPPLCRSGTEVFALHQGRLARVAPDVLALTEHAAEELVESEHRCLVRRGAEWMIATPSLESIALEPAQAPARETEREGEVAGTDGVFVAQIEWMGLAPNRDAVAIASRGHAYLLSADGLRALSTPHQNCRWHSNGLLACGAEIVPVEVPTARRPSLAHEVVRSVADADPWTIPEIAAVDRWRNDVRDAAARGAASPPFPLEPVCSDRAPSACVRAHLTGTAIDGWEVFDPGAPEVVRARLPITVPPGAGHVVVSPGGRYVRETTSGVAIHATLPGDRTVIVGAGSWTEITTGWAELPSGWVVIDPDDHRVLRALRHDGPAMERRFESPLDRVMIVDEGHVFVRALREGGDEGHVIDVETLESSRVLSLGAAGEDGVLRCLGGRVVSADGRASERVCPVSALRGTEDGSVSIASSGAFWLDGRRLDQLVVHRTSDDATLSISLVGDGVIASSQDGAFEILGDVDVGALRLLEAARWDVGPIREAPAPRSGLVRAFFASP